MLTLDVVLLHQVWASHAWRRTTSSVMLTLDVVLLYSTACDAHTWCSPPPLNCMWCSHLEEDVVLLHWASHAVEWRRTTSSVRITCSWLDGGLHQVWETCSWVEEDYIKCEHHMQLSGGGLHSSVSITCSWVEDYIKCDESHAVEWRRTTTSVMHHSWV